MNYPYFFFILTFFITFIVCKPVLAKTIFVDHAAVGNDDGSSWTDAFIDLQDALAASEANDEIWSTAGIYRPDQVGGNRTSSFQLPDAVGMYGGFTGSEGSLDERIWNQNVTIFSGNLNANDQEGGDENRDDNSFHVVSITGSGNNALLVGFIGKANYDAKTEGRDFLFDRRVEDTGEFLIKVDAIDNIGSITESRATLLDVVEFMFAYTRPGQKKTPVSADDPYRFAWSLPLDLPRFDFNLYFFDQTQLTLEQIQVGNAELAAEGLHNIANKLGFKRNTLPVRSNQAQTTWYPHILINTGPFANKIDPGQHLTVQSNAEREDVRIVLMEPKENEEILFGQSITVEALISSENGDSIIGSNAVIVRLEKVSGETPITEIDESSDNGSIKLNNDFVPSSAGTWTVEIDWLGNSQYQPKTASREFRVNPSETTIALAFQETTHVLGQALRIIGLLRIRTLNTSNVDLSGVEMSFNLTDPAGTLRPLPMTQTSNDEGGLNGQFETIIPGTVFDMEGNWQLQVSTEGSANLLSSESEFIPIRVLQKPGYAILCLGSVSARTGSRPEGLDDHQRTRDYVKTVLSSNAGFKDDAENPNSLTDDIYEITDGDSKIKLEEAIKGWARQKMSDAPAPLYIVMINHGEIDQFHMNADLPEPMDNVLNPLELNNWLNDLEETLLDQEMGNPLAAEESIVVVLGMCFSGSFINELSKNGRVLQNSPNCA